MCEIRFLGQSWEAKMCPFLAPVQQFECVSENPPPHLLSGLDRESIEQQEAKNFFQEYFALPDDEPGGRYL